MVKTILIVAENKYYHDLYAEMIKGSDCDIVDAYDGEDALLCIEEKKPDLIITDILLSMMAGDTLFLYIRSMPECENIPVIIISDISMRPYKSLKEVDPGLVFLQKTVAGERFISEVEKKLVSVFAVT